jgi:phytoene synthase
MNPDEYCRQKAVARGSSAYYAMLFLPPERRRAITALRAFCREVAGVVDECSDSQIARTKLAWWRTEIGELFSGRARHPVTIALLPHLETSRLTAERLIGIIDGRELALAQTRFLDFTGLAHYCGHASGSMELAAAEVLGYGNPGTAEYARNLGIAFQLTRVICNAGADARRNRIYLPMDELKRFDVPAADILQSRHSDNFARLMAYQARRAEALYDSTLRSLPAEDRRAQRPGLIMASIHRATLAEVERDGFRVLTHRTSLTPLRKFWLAWKTQIGA